jgi:hypothetical protein
VPAHSLAEHDHITASPLLFGGVTFVWVIEGDVVMATDDSSPIAQAGNLHTKPHDAFDALLLSGLRSDSASGSGSGAGAASGGAVAACGGHDAARPAGGLLERWVAAAWGGEHTHESSLTSALCGEHRHDASSPSGGDCCSRSAHGSSRGGVAGARARVAEYPDMSFEYLRDWKYNHMINLDYPGLQLVYKSQVNFMRT